MLSTIPVTVFQTADGKLGTRSRPICVPLTNTRTPRETNPK